MAHAARRDALVTCINRHSISSSAEPAIASWDTSIAHHQPPALQVAGAWWSERPRLGPITVVTQLSTDRLYQLVAMCRAWSGPLSAVVHAAVRHPPHQRRSGNPEATPGGEAAGGGAATAVQRLRCRKQHTELCNAPAELHGLFSHLAQLHQDLDGHSHKTDNGTNNGTAACPAGCQLDLMLAYELYDASSVSDVSGIHPYNALRNYALLQARTPYVAQLDVDMLPSASLHESVMAMATQPSPGGGGQQGGGATTAADGAGAQGWPGIKARLDSRHFVVLPALRYDNLLSPKYADKVGLLEARACRPGGKGGSSSSSSSSRLMPCAGHAAGGRGSSPADDVAAHYSGELSQEMYAGQAQGDRMMSLTKDCLKRLSQPGAKLVTPFSVKDEPYHRATNYTRWFQTPADGEGYSIQHEQGYEPWGLTKRTTTPFWDVRFRGYGWDKVSYILQVNATSSKFFVHPAAFLMHRAHPDTKIKRDHFDGWWNTKNGQGKGSRAAIPNDTTSIYIHMTNLYHSVIAEINANTYAPVLDAATRACVGQLRWWS